MRIKFDTSIPKEISFQELVTISKTLEHEVSEECSKQSREDE
jgi:hypothetical protein